MGRTVMVFYPVVGDDGGKGCGGLAAGEMDGGAVARAGGRKLMILRVLDVGDAAGGLFPPAEEKMVGVGRPGSVGPGGPRDQGPTRSAPVPARSRASSGAQAGRSWRPTCA